MPLRGRAVFARNAMKAIKPDGTEVDTGRPEAAWAARVVKQSAITARQQAILILRRQGKMSTRRVALAFGIKWHTVRAEERRAITALANTINRPLLGMRPRQGSNCRIS